MAGPDSSDESDGNRIIRRDYRQKVSSREIAFVKAQATSESTEQVTNSNLEADYLSLVLPVTSPTATSTHQVQNHGTETDESSMCHICHLPLLDKNLHQLSIAHQACLKHNHPPSALDRNRKGFLHLQSLGWDPDNRRGLGAIDREGILYPITAKAKKNQAGIGASVSAPKILEKQQKLNIKAIRALSAKQKKRDERLRRSFYSSVDLDKYLGPDNCT